MDRIELIERREDILFIQHATFVKSYSAGLLEITFVKYSDKELKGKSRDTYAYLCSLVMYGPLFVCLIASVYSHNWWLMFGIATAWVSLGFENRKYVVYAVLVLFVIVFTQEKYNIFKTAPFLLFMFIVNYWLNRWTTVYRDSELIKRLILDEDFYYDMVTNHKAVVLKRNK